jgi:uncharacterized membrane protein YfcA
VDTSLFSLPFPAAAIGAVAAIVLLAYTVFGLTGFGTSITAAPFLVLLLPLRFAVPMMVILDLAGGAALATRNHRHVARGEMTRLLPWMLIGMVLGVTLLVHVPERVLLLVLGLFILGYLAKAVFGTPRTRTLGSGWSVPLGTAGGVFTALYGTGGPIYTIFLAGRLPDKAQFRATMAALILLTALARIILFTGTGLYAQPGLLGMAALMLPVVLIGLYLGSHLHRRLPARRVVQVLYVVLLVGGLNLVRRSVFG